jgi:chromosome segregation ATPase
VSFRSDTGADFKQRLRVTGGREGRLRVDVYETAAMSDADLWASAFVDLRTLLLTPPPYELVLNLTTGRAPLRGGKRATLLLRPIRPGAAEPTILTAVSTPVENTGANHPALVEAREQMHALKSTLEHVIESMEGQRRELAEKATRLEMENKQLMEQIVDYQHKLEDAERDIENAAINEGMAVAAERDKASADQERMMGMTMKAEAGRDELRRINNELREQRDAQLAASMTMQQTMTMKEQQVHDLTERVAALTASSSSINRFMDEQYAMEMELDQVVDLFSSLVDNGSLVPITIDDGRVVGSDTVSLRALPETAVIAKVGKLRRLHSRVKSIIATPKGTIIPAGSVMVDESELQALRDRLAAEQKLASERAEAEAKLRKLLDQIAADREIHAQQITDVTDSYAALVLTTASAPIPVTTEDGDSNNNDTAVRQVARLRSLLEPVTGALARARDELATEQARVIALVGAARTSGERIAQLEREAADLSTRMQRLSEQLQQADDARTHATNDAAAATKAREVAEQQRQQAEGQLRGLENELGRLRTEYEAVTRQLGDLRDTQALSAKDAEQQRIDTVARLESEAAALRGRIAALDDANKALENHVTDLQKNLESVRAQLTANEAQLATRTHALEESQRAVAALETSKAGLQADNEQTTKQLADITVQYGRLVAVKSETPRAALPNTPELLQRLSTYHSSLASSQQALQDKLLAAIAAKEQADKSHDAALVGEKRIWSTQMDGLRDDLKQRDLQVSTLERGKLDAEGRAELQRSQLVLCEGDRDRARGEATRLRDELDNKTVEHAAALARAEEKRRDAVAQLEAHREHVSHLQASNASQGTQAKSSLERSEREKGALQVQLAALQAKHDTALERAEREKKAQARALRDVGDLFDTLIQPIGVRSPRSPATDTDHDQEIVRLRAVQRALIADHDARDQAKRDALLAVETRYAEADGDRKARALALTTLQHEMNELRAAMDKNDKGRLTMMATTEAQQQRIRELERDDKKWREQIATLQAERDRNAIEKQKEAESATLEREAQLRQLQSRIDQLVNEANEQRNGHDRALEQRNKEHEAALQRLRDRQREIESELDAQRQLTDETRAALARAEEAHAASKAEMNATEKARQLAAAATEAERNRLLSLQSDSARIDGERAAVARQVREVADLYAALSRAFPPPDEGSAIVELGGEIDVSVSCRNLIKLDPNGKTDPLVTIEVEDEQTGEFMLRGRTEWQRNKINPDFKTVVRVKGDAHMQVRFTVYDAAMDQPAVDDTIGSITCTIGELFRSQPIRRSVESRVPDINKELTAKKTILIVQGNKPLTVVTTGAVTLAPAASPTTISFSSPTHIRTGSLTSTPGTPRTPTAALVPASPSSCSPTPAEAKAALVDPSDELQRLRTMHRALAQSLEYSLAQQAATDKRRQDEAAAQTSSIASLRTEVGAATTKIAAMAVEKSVVDQRLADTLTAKQGVESSLEMATRELAALRESSTASLEAANREQQARIANEQLAARTRINALEATEAGLRHQLATETEATADTNRRLMESKKQLDDAEIARGVAITALQNQLVASQKRVAQVEAELSTQGGMVSELQKLSSDQKTSIQSITDERDTARAALLSSREAHEQTLRDLQGQLTIQQGVVGDLRGKLSALESTAATLRSTIQDRDHTIEDLTAQVAVARATQIETQSQLVAAQAGAAAQDAANAVADKASGERLAAMSRARAELEEGKRAAEGALAAEQVRSAALEAKNKSLSDELKNKNTEMDRVIVEQSTAVTDTDSRLKRAQEELTKARAQLALVSEQKRIVDDQLAESQSNAAVLQQRLAAAELEAARAREQLTSVDAERDILRKANNEQNDKLTRLQVTHAALEKSVVQQQAEVGRLTSEQNTVVADTDAKQKKATDEMTKLRTSLATITERARATDEQLAEQQSTSTGLRQRLLEIETQAQRSREQGASLEGEVEALRKQLQDSVALSTRQQAQLGMLDKTVAQQAAEIEELRRQLNEAQAAATGAEVVAKGYAERITGLTASLKTKNEENSQQQLQINNMETRLAKQAEKMQQILKTKNDSDTTGNEDRSKSAAELDAAREAATRQLAELRAMSKANDELTAANDALNARLEELERQHREALALLASSDGVKPPPPPMELDVALSVRNVIRLDWLSKADPLIAIHMQMDDGAWKHVGQTNWLKNKENADFEKRLRLVCPPTDINRSIRVSLYDLPLGEIRDDRLVGFAMAKLMDLMPKDGSNERVSITLSLDNTFDRTLSRRLKQKGTTITLNADVAAVVVLPNASTTASSTDDAKIDNNNLPGVVSRSMRRQTAARASLEAAVTSLSSSNSSLARERSRLDAALRDAESRVRRAEMMVSSSGGAAAEAEHALTEAARERDARLVQLEAERVQSEAVLKQLIEEEQTKRSSVEGARAKLLADLSSSDDTTRALRVKLANEESLNKAHTNRIAELESEKTGLAALLATARATAAPSTPLTSAPSDQSSGSEVRMLELQVKNDHASKVNAQLETALATAQGRVRTLEKEHDTLTTNLHNLESSALAQAQEVVRQVKRVTDALDAAAKKAEADGVLPTGTTSSTDTNGAAASAEKKAESELTYELVITIVKLVSRSNGQPSTPMVALFEQATPSDRLLFVESTERIHELTTHDPVFEKRIVYKRQAGDEAPELLKLNIYDASNDEFSPETMSQFDRELIGSAVLSLTQLNDGREAKLMVLSLDDTINSRLRSSGTRMLVRRWHEAESKGETKQVAETKQQVTTQLGRLNRCHRTILQLLDQRHEESQKTNQLLDDMQKEMDENDKEIKQWERTCLEWQEKATKSQEDVATLMTAMDEMEKAQAEGRTLSFASPPPTPAVAVVTPTSINGAATVNAAAAAAEVAEWEAKWTESEAKLLDAETKLAETEAKLRSIEGKYRASERRAAAAAIPRAGDNGDNDASYLREEMEATKARLEQEASELEDKVKSLKKTISDLESQTRKDKATITALQKENTALRARLGEEPIDYEGIEVKRASAAAKTTPSRSKVATSSTSVTPTNAAAPIPSTPVSRAGLTSPMSPAEDMEIELAPSIK